MIWSLPHVIAHVPPQPHLKRFQEALALKNNSGPCIEIVDGHFQDCRAGLRNLLDDHPRQQLDNQYVATDLREI